MKIGGGETLAGYRVDEPIDAVRVLGFLLEMRRHWLYGDHAVPIERHSMLVERLDGGTARAGRQGHLAVPSPAGLGGDLRGHPRRLPGRILLGHARSARGSRSASATGRAR